MDLVTKTHAGGMKQSGSAPITPCLLAAAGRGDGEACHALGVVLSTGSVDRRDLIEAHKWFNLGALYGYEEAALSRADIAAEMARSEIAEAQRRAREWLGGELRRAA